MALAITDECIACGVCLEVCPQEALVEGEIYQINYTVCDRCGTCIGVCPTGAIVEK